MLITVGTHGESLLNKFSDAVTLVDSEAERELAKFYPPDTDGAKPLAYFWSRTALCERPKCGAEIPLVSSLWLSKKPRRMRALRPKVSRLPNGVPVIDFEGVETQRSLVVPDLDGMSFVASPALDSASIGVAALMPTESFLGDGAVATGLLLLSQDGVAGARWQKGRTRSRPLVNVGAALPRFCQFPECNRRVA